MKRLLLLLVATVLLLTVTCDSDVPEITNVRIVTATSRSDQETTRRHSDFSRNPFWWKREERRNGAQIASAIRSSTEETFIPSGLRPFAKQFESSPISPAISKRRSQQNEARKSATREYLRYRSASPVGLAATKLGEPYGTDLISEFTLCISKNGCPLPYHRQQGWQLQQPFYVEEPSWIEIDTAANQPIHRLGSTDPFVMSRGKKIPATDRSIHDNFNVSLRNCFINDNNDGNDDKDNDEDNGDKSERQRVAKNTIERGDILASEEILARRHRMKHEILSRLFRHRTTEFHLRNEADRFVENFPNDDSVLVIGRNEGIGYQRNRLLRHGDVETTVVVPNGKPSNLFDTFEPRPNYFSTDKIINVRRFDDQNNRLFQKSKSKRLDSNFDFDSDSDNDNDSDSNPSLKKFAVKEMLQRLIENLECNLEMCRDNGRTTKRTRLGDGRETLEDMLTKSDPFYVARGKRVVPPTFDNSFFFDG